MKIESFQYKSKVKPIRHKLKVKPTRYKLKSSRVVPDQKSNLAGSVEYRADSVQTKIKTNCLELEFKQSQLLLRVELTLA